jgi:hypothetical protein
MEIKTWKIEEPKTKCKSKEKGNIVQTMQIQQCKARPIIEPCIRQRQKTWKI